MIFERFFRLAYDFQMFLNRSLAPAIVPPRNSALPSAVTRLLTPSEPEDTTFCMKILCPRPPIYNRVSLCKVPSWQTSWWEKILFEKNILRQNFKNLFDTIRKRPMNVLCTTFGVQGVPEVRELIIQTKIYQIGS